MKKICVILAAFLLGFFPTEAETIKKTYDIDDFTGISVTSAIQVTLEKSKTFGIEVEVPEELLPYLVVKNRAGVLELGFASIPLKLRQKDHGKLSRAVVRMPVLTDIELSGSATLTANDQFTNAMNNLSIKVKGSSTIQNLNVKAPEADIEISGASKAVINLRASEVDVELGGASRLELNGKATELDAEVGGASRLEASGFAADDVDVKIKGASSADVRPIRHFTVDLSGASKCRYYGDEDKLKITVVKVAGASTLKHQDL